MANDSVLQLSPEQREAAMALLSECSDLREFGCRVLEATMNAMMDAEAQAACGAARGERGGGRVNSRNGYRARTLRTAVGDLDLQVPKLRSGTYSPAGLLGRYTRVEASMAALVQEMYVAGVSTRKVERVAAELGVSSLSSSEVSSLCSGLDAEVEAFRGRPLGPGAHPYVWLDATYMKCRRGGRYASLGLVTAIGLSEDGHKEFLGCDVVDTESYESWKAFIRGLRGRGLAGVRLVVSDDHAGLVRAVQEAFSGCAWQRCVTHLQRNVQGHAHTLEGKRAVAALVRAATTQPDLPSARAVWEEAAPWVRSVSRAAGEVFEAAREDALAFMSFPPEHWPKIRTNNVQERANREIKRRYRSVQSFPSEASMLRLVGSVLIGEEGAWAAQAMFSRASAARAMAPAPAPEAPDEDRANAVRLHAADVVRQVVDRYGLKG